VHYKLVISAIAALSLCAAALGIVVASNNVEVDVTSEDALAYAHHLPDALRNVRASTFAEELDLISRLQRHVLAAIPAGKGIPLDRPREPGDVYAHGSSLCADRARVLEKFLKIAGFETRHVSLYPDDGVGSRLDLLFKRLLPSHALTEVCTRKGWMLIDSIEPWVALTPEGLPLSARDQASLHFTPDVVSAMPGLSYLLREKRFLVIYGLYSRHGRFYPPYNSIPDVSVREWLSSVRETCVPAADRISRGVGVP
jgi:hypothetical protein